MIKNIIFDVGKVLVDWNPRTTMQELGFTAEEIEEIYSAIFESGIWLEEDRGAIIHDDMYDFLASKCPKHADKIKLFYDHATDSLCIMPYTHDWIKSLKEAGYNIYILSNFGEYAWNKAVRNGIIDFLDLADGKLVSYEVKQVKPDAEIYNILLSRYDLVADECLFIDDSAVNVAGAKEVGINAIVFTSYDDANTQISMYT